MVGYCERFYVNSTLFLLFLCLNYFVSGDNYKLRSVPEDVVSDLYLKYKEAILDDKTNISSRRLFKNDKQYEIHVKKLKDVNGFKVHNLMIKENLRTESDPLIYINNPVESKIPKAYLSLEEFKSVLTNRVMKQRNELTTKMNRNIFKIKPKKVNIKQKMISTKLHNKMKSVNVTDTSNVTLTTEFEDVLDKTTTSLSRIILNASTMEPITKKLHTINENLTTDLDSMTSPSSVILDTPTMEDIRSLLPKVHTESTINYKPKEEESIHFVQKQLVDVNSDSIKFSDKVLATTIKLDIANETTDKNEDETASNTENRFLETAMIANVTNITNKKIHEVKKEIKNNESEILITKNQLFNTTIDNVSENILETTVINNTSIIDKNVQEFNKEINNNESEDKINTDLKTLQVESVNTAQTTIVKEKPRRKTTIKLSQVSKVSLKPLKRSTLGRPLVFMGN